MKKVLQYCVELEHYEKQPESHQQVMDELKGMLDEAWGARCVADIGCQICVGVYFAARLCSYLMLSNQFLSNTYPKKSCIGFCLHQFGLCPPCGRVKACEIIDEITVQGVLHRNTAAKRKDNTNDGSPSNHSSRRQTKVATGSVMFRWLIFLTPSGDTCNVSYFFSSS